MLALLARYAVPAVLLCWAMFTVFDDGELQAVWLVLVALACIVQGRALWEHYTRD